jgi:hypothetical protein
MSIIFLILKIASIITLKYTQLLVQFLFTKASPIKNIPIKSGCSLNISTSILLQLKRFHKLRCKIPFSKIFILHQLQVKRNGGFYAFNYIFA